MVYESLSSIVMVVIAAILVLAWLPGRTVRGMKRASEHRQDKLSTSLHMVGEQDGMRFGDAGPQTAKGLVMQQKQQDKASLGEAQRIRRVRQMRREAIRRRRILVVSLLVVTALVAGFSFPMEYSFWFMLIPLALTVMVLIAGAHASAQARAWEANLARRKALQRRQRAASLTKGGGRPSGRAAVSPADGGESVGSPSEIATDVLDQQEINRTIAKAREDKRAALSARKRKTENMAANTGTGEKGATKGGKTPSADAKIADRSERRGGVRDAAERNSTSSAEKAGQPAGAGKTGKAARKAGKGTVSLRGQQVNLESFTAAAPAQVSGDAGQDATHELERIKPSPALDAFEMAASQDLISFSLGSPRNGSMPESEGPQSLEIKSTRQVSKAEPAKAETRGKKAGKRKNADRAGKTGTGSSEKGRVDMPKDFHQREMEADVEVPKQSSDSLSIGVEAILARRQPSRQD